MKFRERLKRVKDFTNCPRCGNKCLKSQQSCDECGLIFSRLKYASNKIAKRQLLHFNRDYIIYTKDLPKDVKRWKIILYAVLFGLVGGHYYYVGKFGKGIMMTLGFAYLVVCTVLNPFMVEYMEANYLFVPIGIYGLAWLVSIVLILSKKFKVPILIDEKTYEIEINEKRADFDRLKKQITEENKESKESKNKKARKKKVKTETDKLQEEEK